MIIFGDGIFGKETGMMGVLWRVLKKRETEGGLTTVTIGELNTSKIRSKCYSDALKLVSYIHNQDVLECKTCTTLWQRDINAAKNK